MPTHFAPIVLLCLWAAIPAAAQAAPNVILIMTDDQGYGDLSLTGNPVLQTPHIDRLAAEGAWFSNFCVSPVCTPTRASLMTGRYNYRTRAIDTYLGRAMLEPEETTVAELLQVAGYATGIFGKWHLGDCYPMRPGDQGFEESLVHRGGGLRQPSAVPGGERYFNPTLLHNGRVAPQQGYCTDVYFTAALSWVEQQAAAARPFFCYLATNAPHDPLDEVPANHLARFLAQGVEEKSAAVYAMAANIDENIGRLLSLLEDRRLAGETLVIYLHDNGRGFERFNAGLRGFKGQMYEGGIRTPCLLRGPGIPAGQKIERLAAHIDLSPTILQACGVPLPEGLAQDGRSLWPLLENPAAPWPERTLFFQWHRGNQPELNRNFAARTERWKLLRGDRSEAPFELYDLQADPAEQRNLAEAEPMRVQQLQTEYAAWFEDVGARQPENYAPPPIHVPAPDGVPVTLTLQDLRVEGPEQGWRTAGGWELHVEADHSCQVQVLLDQPLASAAAVLLQLGNYEAELSLPAGGTHALFADVPCAAGDCRLTARVVGDEAGARVYQVEIRPR